VTEDQIVAIYGSIKTLAQGTRSKIYTTKRNVWSTSSQNNSRLRSRRSSATQKAILTATAYRPWTEPCRDPMGFSAVAVSD
jgi:hypothetical protein